jgi:tetratricopeptide (TPR) repeat protein
MLPVTNLIPIPTIYNDRYLYLSILSFPVLIYLILWPIIVKKRLLKNIVILIFAIVVLSCGSLSYQRNKIWHNSVSFWSDVVKKAPTSHKAHNNLASSYARRGWLDKAIEEYKESLAINQNYAAAHNNLGLAYARKDLLDKARKEWEIALEIDPELTQSRENLQRLDKIIEEKERLNDKR